MRPLLIIPLVLTTVAAGCARLPVHPSGAWTGVSASGQVVWHDLITPDPSASTSFYARVFGWEFEPSGYAGYKWIRQDGQIIGGLFDAAGMAKAPSEGRWLCSFAVADIATATAAVRAHGGRILNGPRKSAGMGVMAAAADPDGATFQLTEASRAWPVEPEPGLHRWLWTELIAPDVEKAAVFYRDILGCRVEDVPGRERAVLLSDDTPRAGISVNPFDGTNPAWIPFVRVDDAAAMAALVGEAGGRVVLNVEVDPPVVLLLDNTGAPFAVQEWQPAAAAVGGAP